MKVRTVGTTLSIFIAVLLCEAHASPTLKHTDPDGSSWEFKNVPGYYVNPKTRTAYLDEKSCGQNCSFELLNSEEGVIIYQSPKGFSKIVKTLRGSDSHLSAQQYIRSCESAKNSGGCDRQAVAVQTVSSPTPSRRGPPPKIITFEPKSSLTVEWNCPHSLPHPHPRGMPPAFRQFTITGDPEKGFNTTEVARFIKTVAKSEYDYSSCITQLAKLTMAKPILDDNGCKTEECRLNARAILVATKDAITASKDPSKKDRTQILGDLSGEIDDILKIELTEVASQCHVLENSGDGLYGLRSQVYLSRQFIEERLPILENAAPKNCKGKYIEKVLEALTSKLQLCDLNEKSIECRRNIENQIPGILDKLKPLIPPTTQDSYGFDDFARTDCVTRNDDLDRLLSDIRNLKNIQACTSLSPGERAPVSIAGSAPFPPVAARYELERVNKNKYKASIPVKFEPETRDAEFRKRANECLKKVSPAMAGPDGIQLEISLEKKTSDLQPSVIEAFDYDTCQRAKRNLFRPESESKEALPEGISPEFFKDKECGRANAGWWYSHMPCSTITHEVLHLLGLCDEYKEKWRGYRINPETGKPQKVEMANDTDQLDFVEYDCRISGPADSTMSIHTDSFRAIGLDAHGNPDPSASPYKSSLLLPGQFNAIIYPGCKSKNDNYYRCMQYSYRSSWKEDGDTIKKTGCGDEEEIKECRKRKWLYEAR